MFHNLHVEQIVKQLHTNSARGLTQTEVAKRLAKFGPNTLPIKKRTSLLFRFLSQFTDMLVLILLGATILSFFFGEYIDGLAILAIVAINATIGFVQEIQAEKTLASLAQKDKLYATVIRDGKTQKIPAENIVPGDLLIIDEGVKIPADCRIITSFSLRIDESILTGESAPISKQVNPLPPNTSLADRINMLYRDTTAVSGRATVLAVATGKDTEIGKIATFLKSAPIETSPLTREINSIGHLLTILIGIIAVVMLLLNLARHTPFIDSVLLSISIAVAAIPEGLPAIVTIVLAIGVTRLAAKKTLVKKLVAAETLGAVRIIATDKTGTLTQNKINVKEVYLADGATFTIDGHGYDTQGTFFNAKGHTVDVHNNPQLQTILTAAVLANNATISDGAIIGDTTEGALVVAGARAQLSPDTIRRSHPRIFEVPFSAERKMMSVVVQIDETDEHMLYVKGAPEIIVQLCKQQNKNILKYSTAMAKKGFRTLAVAQRQLTKSEVKQILETNILEEKNLQFLGVFSMVDPLRPEIKDALSQARDAGIATIMITGDHASTALTIAQEAGIADKNTKVLTETDVDKLTKKQLAHAIVKGACVFARISPLTKLKIVDCVKSIPHTHIAVTGDGVNDAPALQSAHIGIAMGKTGTDITREVADVVITDDNYATIIDAIREGRVIYANLVKFIRYLISCNISEVLVVALGVLFSTATPLIPIQILWINLMTDGFPALALGLEKAEYDVMKRPPRNTAVPLLHTWRLTYMSIEGIIMGIVVFTVFLWTGSQTITFTTLAFVQLTHAFNNRSTRASLFKIGFFTNKYLILAVIFSVTLQLIVVQTSIGNTIFKTQPLNAQWWLVVAAVSLIPFFVVELKKLLRFRVLP